MNVIQNAVQFPHKAAWLHKHKLKGEPARHENQNGLNSQMHLGLELGLWDKVIRFLK